MSRKSENNCGRTKKSGVGILPIDKESPMTQLNSVSSVKPIPSRNSFAGTTCPRRRGKTIELSPEARREVEDRNRQMIEEFCAQGRVTRLPTRWANGAVVTSTLQET
jgi:hypothetical protein